MKVLVTGFDPFGGESINPAIESVKKLPNRIEDAEIVKLEVPTVFGRSFTCLREAIERENPDVVLCVGQAGGRSHITVERVAINLMDARIADNDGNSPMDEPIVAGGPAAYFTNFPIKAMVHEMTADGIPASLSYTAGTFVCNALMYTALHESALRGGKMRAGFIHIPYLPEQVATKAGVASMALEQVVKGLEVAIKAIINNDIDRFEAGGTIC